MKTPSQHTPSFVCHILQCHLTPFFVEGDNLWPWAMLAAGRPGEIPSVRRVCADKTHSDIFLLVWFSVVSKFLLLLSSFGVVVLAFPKRMFFSIAGLAQIAESEQNMYDAVCPQTLRGSGQGQSVRARKSDKISPPVNS